VLARAIGAWRVGLFVLRGVFLLKPLVLGQLLCSSHWCLNSWCSYSRGSFLVQAIGAWTMGVVVLRSVF